MFHMIQFLNIGQQLRLSLSNNLKGFGTLLHVEPFPRLIFPVSASHHLFNIKKYQKKRLSIHFSLMPLLFSKQELH